MPAQTKSDRDPSAVCSKKGCNSYRTKKGLDASRCYWHQPERDANHPSNTTQSRATPEEVEADFRDGHLSRDEAISLLSELARGVEVTRSTATGETFTEIDRDLQVRSIDKIARIKGWQEETKSAGPTNLIVVNMPTPPGMADSD